MLRKTFYLKQFFELSSVRYILYQWSLLLLIKSLNFPETNVYSATVQRSNYVLLLQCTKQVPVV